MFYQLARATRKRRFSSTHVAFLVIVFLLHGEDVSAQWRITPSLSVGLEHDSNVALSTISDLDVSASGYLLKADAIFTYKSPVSAFIATPSVRFTRYDELSTLDSNDAFLDVRYGHSGQKHDFAFRAQYSDESTRTAERSDVDFDIEDPGEIPSDDSGRLLLTEKRQRIMLDPKWTYQLGQRSRFVLGARHIDVSYDDRSERLLTLTDFQETTGWAAYEYDWTKRNTLIVDAFYRDNRFQRSDNAFSGYGFLIGINRSISEQTEVELKVGNDSTEDVTANRQSNIIGEISFIQLMEKSKIIASYRRSVTGNGTGRISMRDEISLNFTHDLSPRMSINLGVRTYQTEALSDSQSTANNRDYVQFRALFTRNISEVLSVELDYFYTYLNRRILSTYADSNRINLWLRYSPVR
jgi:hypothetical protein